MAWKQVKMEEQRKKFIVDFLEKNGSFTDICRQYDISRKTGYKWVERYQTEDNTTCYINRSKAPHTRPTAINDHLISPILEMRIRFPKLGPKKIYAKLKERSPLIKWPPPSSIGNILDRYGLTVRRKLRRRFALNNTAISFGDEPNDVWSLDFKGTMRTADGAASDPFTLTDNVSRFLIKCQILKANNGKYVWAVLDAAFREYGLPARILSDNGPPFATAAVGRLSKVSINLIKAGVLPTWIEPGKPQQNGRHERMHGTLKSEIESDQIKSHIELGNKLLEFQDYFNFERPHEALGQKVPGSVYTPSKRVWDGQLRHPEYSNDYIIRKVQKPGDIYLNGNRIFISEALWGEPIGLLEEEAGLQAYYGPILLGSINADNRLEYPRIKPRRRSEMIT